MTPKTEIEKYVIRQNEISRRAFDAGLYLDAVVAVRSGVITQQEGIEMFGYYIRDYKKGKATI